MRALVKFIFVATMIGTLSESGGDHDIDCLDDKFPHAG
jgi:hypothetical protein